MGQITRTTYGLTKRIRFTNAQVLNWPTTPLHLLDGIGNSSIGRLWLPQTLFIVMDAATGSGGPFAYTNIDPAASIKFLSPGIGLTLDIISFPFEPLQILGAPQEASARSVNGHIGNAQHVGEGLDLIFNNQGAGNLTGGDQVNYLDVQLHYVEWSRHEVNFV